MGVYLDPNKLPLKVQEAIVEWLERHGQKNAIARKPVIIKGNHVEFVEFVGVRLDGRSFVSERTVRELGTLPTRRRRIRMRYPLPHWHIATVRSDEPVRVTVESGGGNPFEAAAHALREAFTEIQSTFERTASTFRQALSNANQRADQHTLAR